MIEKKIVILTEKDERIRRKKEYEKIQKDIIHIVEIFKDLENIVNKENDTLDLIKCNISNTKEKIKNSENNIIKSELYQNKSRWLKFGTFSIFISGIGVPLGIIFGTKIAISVICGTTITYIITN